MRQAHTEASRGLDLEGSARTMNFPPVRAGWEEGDEAQERARRRCVALAPRPTASALTLLGEASSGPGPGMSRHSHPPPQSGIINTYFPGLGTVPAGATSSSINTNAATGAGANIIAGDMLVVIQMQDADVNSTNDGNYGDGGGGNPGFGQTALNDAGGTSTCVARNSLAVGTGSQVLQIAGAAAATNGLLFSYEPRRSRAATAPRSASGASRSSGSPRSRT